MSKPIAGQGSSIRKSYKTLYTWIATDAWHAQVDILKRDVFEIFRLICVRRNTFAPINRDILTLTPDFWNTHERDQDTIFEGLTASGT